MAKVEGTFLMSKNKRKMSKKSIIEKISERFDKKTMSKFVDLDAFSDVDHWYSSGVPRIDYKMNTLGFPPGIIEIAGPSMCGKTTLALHSMAAFLRKYIENGFAIILSSEGRDNKEYAERIGINTSDVLVVKSKFVEDLLLKAQSLINNITEEWQKEGNSGKPRFFFMWDSLGSTLSRAEISTMDQNLLKMEKSEESGKGYELDHEQMAAFAKQAKKMAKFMMAHSYESHTSFVIINHVHDKIGGTPGTKSGGGKWVEYMPTIRLKMVKIANLKGRDPNEIGGQTTMIEIIKSDYGTKHKFNVDILLGHGFILTEEDIDFGVAEEIIEAPSAKVREALNGKLRWKSAPELYDLYKNPKTASLLRVLHKKITRLYHEKVLKNHGK